MDCCDNRNITCKNCENICINCGVIHGFTCSRLRCTFLSSPKLVYIGELYFCVILFSALPNLFT